MRSCLEAKTAQQGARANAYVCHVSCSEQHEPRQPQAWLILNVGQKMKLYSEKIGPVEYFRGIGFACFFLPYAMGVPRWWPICLLISIGAYLLLGRVVKKEEPALRDARSGDPRIAKIVSLFGMLMFANAGLIRLLQ